MCNYWKQLEYLSVSRLESTQTVRQVRHLSSGRAAARLCGFFCRLRGDDRDLGNKKPPQGWLIYAVIDVVPRRGLEPPRCYSLVPETSASTNSATWASIEEPNSSGEFLLYYISYSKTTALAVIILECGAQERTRTSTMLLAST